MSSLPISNSPAAQSAYLVVQHSNSAQHQPMDTDSRVSEIGRKRILKEESKEESDPSQPRVRRKVLSQIVTRSMKRKSEITEHNGIHYQGAVKWNGARTQILKGALADECKIEENVYPAGSIVEFREEDGKLFSVLLSEDALIQGVKCKKNSSVYFEENGDFTATLAQEQEIDGLPCKGGTQFSRYHHGGCYLTLADGPPQKIRGIFCQGGTPASYSPDYLKGTLGEPIKKKEFENLPAIHAGNEFISYSETHFEVTSNIAREPWGIEREIQLAKGTVFHYENESIWFTAAKGGTIKGVPCKERTPILVPYYMFGKPENNHLTFTPENDCEFSGVGCKGGNPVSIHLNGKLVSATLTSNQTIQGIPFLAGTVITFKGDLIESGTLSEDQVIQNIPCKRGGEIEFFVTLQNECLLRSAILSRDFDFRGVPCLKGTKIYEEYISIEQGNPHITLGKDYEIDGFHFKANTKLQIVPLSEFEKMATFTLTENQQIKGASFREGAKIFTKDSTGRGKWRAYISQDRLLCTFDSNNQIILTDICEKAPYR